MLRALVLLAALAAPPQPVEGVANTVKWNSLGAACSNQAGSCPVLSAVAATASAGSRTFTIPVAHYSVTTIQINFTRTAGTAVTLTCTASLNGGSSYGSITSTAISSGAGTVTPYVDTWTTSASGNILLDYATARYDDLQCVVAVTTGGASDTFSVYAVSATR